MLRPINGFLSTKLGPSGPFAVYLVTALLFGFGLYFVYLFQVVEVVMPFVQPPGGRYPVNFSTPHSSIRGLGKAVVNGNSTLRFETPQSPDPWSFVCEAPNDDLGNVIGLRKRERLWVRVKISGWIDIPPTASPGLFEGKVRGFIAAPVLVSSNLKAGFEIRELPIDWPIRIKVLSQNDYAPYQRNRILYITLPLLLLLSLAFLLARRIDQIFNPRESS